MTPQCTPICHYTKKPLLSQNNHVTMLNSSKSNKKKLKCDKEKNRIKCVIVGDQAVGKTSLAVSYSNDSFPSEYKPTAYDNYNVDVLVDGKPTRVELCDTAGEVSIATAAVIFSGVIAAVAVEMFGVCNQRRPWQNTETTKTLTPAVKVYIPTVNPDELDPLRHLCYPGTDVFMLCFSIVKPNSFFSACSRWAEELNRLGAAVVLVGTQADLTSNKEVINELRKVGQRPVLSSEAKGLAERLNAPYIETSAKACTHLKEAFDMAIVIALKRQKKPRQVWKKFMCCVRGMD